TPEWALRNSHRPRKIRVEAAQSRALHDRQAQRQRTAVLDAERKYGVAITLERLTGCHLSVADRKVLFVASERHRLAQQPLRLGRPEEPHGLGPALQRHGAYESRHPENVVSVHVGEKDVTDVE